MKKVRSMIGLLSLSLVVLLSTALSSSSAKAAGLYCFQLAGCSGTAGCLNYASVIGPCTIQCLGGGVVYCDFSGGGGDGGGGGGRDPGPIET